MSGDVARLLQNQGLELWWISADGGGPQNPGLSMEGQELYALNVHPDRRYIAFIVGTPPHTEVWVAEELLTILRSGNRPK